MIDWIMTIKYVLRPGSIQKANESMYRFSANDLIELYKVHIDDCIVLCNDDASFDEKFCTYASKGYIFLYPRSDGSYTWLHEKQKSYCLNANQER